MWPLVHVSQMWTVWITVLVAFNRYVAICRPFQAIRVCTMRQARLQVFAGAVVIIVYNIPRFLEHRLDFYSEVIASPTPFPSKGHHRSNGDCLQGKRENYHVCSVQYCVQQLYSELHTHMNRTNSSLDWVLSHWAHFTVLRFIFVYVLFCV